MSQPILYSFRRCPYAMRARLAIASAGITCTLREISLRDKAAEFTRASPKATVPVIVNEGTVIEESLDIMHWALGQNDPKGWLDMPQAGHDLIAQFDGPFKSALDRTKYANRFPEADPDEARGAASAILRDLDQQLGDKLWLYGDDPRLADMAIICFVRQFAMIDKPWFDAQPWPSVIDWLDRFLLSDRFRGIMAKYDVWAPGDAPITFPG